MNLKHDLSNQQRKVVKELEGPLLVLSCAGSGKTRCITYRIANMVAEGINPENILTLTFTNKAANEMKERANKLTNNSLEGIWMGTFHSIGARILSDNLKKMGYQNKFTIYDQNQSVDLIENIMEEIDFNIDEMTADKVFNKISKIKRKLLKPDEYIKKLRAEDINISRYNQKIAKTYKLYEERLKNNYIFDFQDLIVKTIRLLRKNKDLLEYYQNKFKYVQIDEYQDINNCQYEMTKLLSQPQDNIMVVGDENQSVYKFRGADLSNILNFQNDYKDTKTIKLEKNYRSTQNIVEASNAVIENNTERTDKKAIADKANGSAITVIKNKSPQAEGQFISNLINRFVSTGYKYKDIAVLYRSHFQSEPVESKLVEYDVPYNVVSSFRFFDREEIRHFIGLLEFLDNPNNNLALVNIMKMFNNNIGVKLIGRMSKHGRENNIKLIDILPNADVVRGIGKKRSESLKEFHDNYIIPSLELLNTDKNLSDKLIEIYEDIFNYDEMLSKYENPQNRKENIQQLINFISLKNKEQDMDLSEVLQTITLMTDQEDPDTNEEENKVKLMTMHASKGLEFPVVILIGLEEDIMPHNKALLEENGVEEERRLFYVAMTRAEERLITSYCYSRLKFGSRITPKPSRFLEELPSTRYKKVSNF